MIKVKAKKHLGQHFLMDQNIAMNIVEAMVNSNNSTIIEVGPGTGVLTQYLLKRDSKLLLSEVDMESVAYLLSNFEIEKKQFTGDFLKLNLSEIGSEKVNVIGNFPYNISSQIYFKILDHVDIVDECVGMLQKEVAERLASKEGSKKYGILSVLLQLYYDIEYLFSVGNEVFDPPPKVQSGVIRMVRNSRSIIDDEKHFKRIVKMAFSTRRKTLRNALKPLNLSDEIREQEVFSKRAEQLSVEEFIALAKLVR